MFYVKREFKFEADISLEEWQIEDLERQIIEEVHKRFGEDSEVEQYGFSLVVTVRVSFKNLISALAKMHGVSEEYVANNISEFIKDF